MADIFDKRPPVPKVIKLGNPILRESAKPLSIEEIKDPQTQDFIDSMVAAMPEYNAAGFAAPQFGVSRQIIVIEGRDNPRYPGKDEVPFTILINPKITSFSNEMEEGWEGCISVTALWGKVKRSTAITVEGLTRDGDNVEIKADGFYAVVLQHEIDHLHGVVFLDRMEDMSSLSFTEEYNRFQN